MKIKIKRLDKEIELPKYQRDGDAAMDIRSAVDVTIPHLGGIKRSRLAVKSGLCFELPDGYVGLVWDRSGMAFKHGIHTLAGVLDSNYRGELLVVLQNLAFEDFEIHKGDRIAQLLIQKVEQAEIEESEDLTSTDRGASGFLSTGTK